jgi:hypothetical protein
VTQPAGGRTATTDVVAQEVTTTEAVPAQRQQMLSRPLTDDERAAPLDEAM